MERTRTIADEPLLKGLQVTNFKAFSTPIEVPIRPITLIFGANSVGKSSLIQSLLLLKQTLEDKSNAALLPRGSEIDLGSFYEFVHCHELERSVSFKITTNMREFWKDLDELKEHALISVICKDAETIGLKFVFTYEKDEREIVCSSLELFVGEDLQPLAIFNSRPEKEERKDQIHDELFLTKVNHEHSVIQRIWEDEVSEFKELLLNVIENAEIEFAVKAEEVAYELRYELRKKAESLYSARDDLESYTIESFAQEFPLYYKRSIILDHLLLEDSIPKKALHDLDDFPRFYALSKFRNMAREWLYGEIFRLSWPGNNPDYFLLKKDDTKTIENLARKLRSRPNVVSEYLYKCLTTATQKLLDKSSGDSKALLNALAKEMNELIRGPSLYANKCFTGIELAPQMKRILEPPTGVKLIIMNRLLLEGAYPNEIEKCKLEVEYTDLGNILDSFLPIDIAVYAGKALRQALSEIVHIGPLRQRPERFYTFQGAKTHQVGKSGERAFDLLMPNKDNKDTLEKVNKFLRNLRQEYDLQILPLKTPGDEVTDSFVVRLRDSTWSSVSITDVGFGISQVLPVIIQSAFSKGKVLCIEQPELHLHPGAQAELGDLFIESALTQSNTFIIETHSEHLLLRILRRIRETTENTLEEGKIPITPDDVQVVYAKSSRDGTKLYTLEVTIGGDLTKWPAGFFEGKNGGTFLAMLLHEFAIEPEAIANWKDFWAIVGKCGVHHGRLISRFPSKWEKEVLQLCKERCTGIQFKKITERLVSLKRQFIKNNRHPENNKSWLENARQQHEIKPFYAVITAQPNKYPSPQEFIHIEDAIDETAALWNVQNGIILPRCAETMAKCALPLFQISHKIILIDPHFNPDYKRYTDSLLAFIEAIKSVNPTIKSLEYHIGRDDKSPPKEYFIKSCNKFAHKLPNGFQIHFVRWGDKDSHPRYVLTDIGGINFERGLDTGPNKTNAMLLDSDMYKEIWEEFQLEEYQNEPNKPFESIWVKS